MKNYLYKIKEFSVLLMTKNPLVKKMGFRKEDKLLIIQADDLGMANSVNNASLLAMKEGIVSSGSIMVPCPGYRNLVENIRSFKEFDLGIHLTLTSEWPNYKWGPVLDVREVPSLVDHNGFFYGSKKEFLRNFSLKDVEKEFRAQIETALSDGIALTHIDSHMFIADADKEISGIIRKIGNDYKLPVLLRRKNGVRKYFQGRDMFVDKIYFAKGGHFYTELKDIYYHILLKLDPGINILLIHPAYNDKEMKNITGDTVAYGALWRQYDFDLFSGDEYRKLIADNNIQIITWKRIRKALYPV